MNILPPPPPLHFFMPGLKHGSLFMFSFSLPRQRVEHWPCASSRLTPFISPIPLSLPLCDRFSQRETVSRQFCACRFHSASVLLLYCFPLPIILLYPSDAETGAVQPRQMSDIIISFISYSYFSLLHFNLYLFSGSDDLLLTRHSSNITCSFTL